MSDLFNTGIRPAVDGYLKKKSEEIRDYGDYWSASSAGYCMRLNMMRRLGVPPVPEIADSASRTRVFEAGHIFHEWIQRITRDAGLSVAQELELQDESLMIRGHIDDLVLVETEGESFGLLSDNMDMPSMPPTQHLILYDYKTAHSASFNYKKNRPIGQYHKMQLATYMYMLRNMKPVYEGLQKEKKDVAFFKDKALFKKDVEALKALTEARILSISKDDLRMHEDQLMWSPELEKEVIEYWTTLNKFWKEKKLPPCTCLDIDGGFMGKRSSKGKVYNDYFYEDQPCSIKWLEKTKKEGLWTMEQK